MDKEDISKKNFELSDDELEQVSGGDMKRTVQQKRVVKQGTVPLVINSGAESQTVSVQGSLEKDALEKPLTDI